MIEPLTTIDTAVKDLLSEATARNEVEQKLQHYLTVEKQNLYLYYEKTVLAGCIGILRREDRMVELTHIAVREDYRCKKIGTQLLDFIEKRYSPSKLVAETDAEAVDFYRKSGFEISSLGEKYPGVERFYCVKTNGNEGELLSGSKVK